jgi:catechol 2,3-dioxygenase
VSGHAPLDPEELERQNAPVRAKLPDSTTVGAVELTVADLERSLSYYREAVGLRVLAVDGNRASLGVEGRELLRLVEEPAVKPARGYSGLYHFALLLPERRDLARWLAHAARERIALVGLSDHFVSEALYLSDPDEHGIEIYWDRPRETWEGQVAVRMTTLPLDVEDLLSELPGSPVEEPFESLPSGTRMGHVHLKVARIPETLAFYRDVLGFGVMAQLGSHALFISAGGYHHHLGANTWESADAPAAPPGTAALRHATIVLPSADELELVLDRVCAGGYDVEQSALGSLVRDPTGIALLLTCWQNAPA